MLAEKIPPHEQSALKHEWSPQPQREPFKAMGNGHEMVALKTADGHDLRTSVTTLCHAAPSGSARRAKLGREYAVPGGSAPPAGRGARSRLPRKRATRKALGASAPAPPRLQTPKARGSCAWRFERAYLRAGCRLGTEQADEAERSPLDTGRGSVSTCECVSVVDSTAIHYVVCDNNDACDEGGNFP